MAGYIKKIARYLKKEEVHCSTPQSAHSCIVVDFLTQTTTAGTGETDFF